MQISITAGILEKEIRRKHSENTKNPEMTEEWLDTDCRLAELGMNDTNNEQMIADDENNK